MAIEYSVFVIMPFLAEAHSKAVFDNGIAPALREVGFIPVRVDKETLSARISTAIKEGIRDAIFCIADLSFERPNCYYEVGFAHALNRRVLFIKARGCETHFDLGDFQCHDFGADEDVRLLIRSHLPGILRSEDRVADTRNLQFGGNPIANDYRLMSRITSKSEGRYYLTHEVISLTESRPLKGRVTFYLHESYPRPVQAKMSRAGVAELLEWSATGPFTIAAVVETDGTKLELDLSLIPGGDMKWYRSAPKLKSVPQHRF